jgi:hypothetical protein
MTGSLPGQAIPTQLGLGLFEQFVLPHLSIGSRGPAPKLGLFKIVNYILQLLYLGCRWKELPIDKDGEGRPEIYYTPTASTPGQPGPYAHSRAASRRPQRIDPFLHHNRKVRVPSPTPATSTQLQA